MSYLDIYWEDFWEGYYDYWYGLDDPGFWVIDEIAWCSGWNEAYDEDYFVDDYY